MGTTLATIDLSETITAGTLDGVLTQVINLIPVVVPVLISFLAIRKGISFVMDMIRSA